MATVLRQSGCNSKDAAVEAGVGISGGSVSIPASPSLLCPPRIPIHLKRLIARAALFALGAALSAALGAGCARGPTPGSERQAAPPPSASAQAASERRLPTGAAASSGELDRARASAAPPDAPRGRGAQTNAETVDVFEIWCPGGLLCESATPLRGWRVPRACADRVDAPLLATCWLNGGDLQPIWEFYRTRYAQVSATPRGLHVKAAPSAPGRAPAELHVTRMGGRYRVLALPGDRPTPP